MEYAPESNNKPSDFGVTAAVFDTWRAPREGTANPTRMDNRVWEWLIRTGISAYEAVTQMQAGSACESGPTWCFDRFGQSSTEMPDGRVIYIAGEHEDYYDPDFYIYNDVVVIDPDNTVSIYGYPKDVFPPTDFHSATLVGDRLFVIGNLGYPDDRRQSIETIHVLDTASYTFTALPTTGDLPPWLYDHKALLNAPGNRIRVTDGLIDRGPGKTPIENLDTWDLDPGTLTWTHVARRPWARWEFFRSDGQRDLLWEIRQARWSHEVGWMNDFRGQVERIASQLGFTPDVMAVGDIYRSGVAHEAPEQDAERHDTYRVVVDGVVVRYVESMYSVQMTIEGKLPDTLAQTLVEEVRHKLSQLERIEYSAEPIP